MLYMDKQYLIDVAEANVKRAWARFAKHYPEINAKPVPKVILNNRLKTTAGHAFLELHYIDLSPELLWEHTQNFVEDTIPHEVGHLVAYIVHGDEGHGKGWKSVMAKAGYPANRLHDMVNTVHAKRRAK